MKKSQLLIIVPAFFLLLACIIAGVSAFTLSSVTVNPRGEQAAGTPLTVSAVIDFPSAGTDTFPSDNELRIRYQSPESPLGAGPGARRSGNEPTPGIPRITHYRGILFILPAGPDRAGTDDLNGESS